MMNTISKIGVSGALAMFLIAPVYAAKQTIGDKALDGITGKANSTVISGSSSLTMGMTSSNGGIQVGYFQWDDDHGADASNHKGANDQSGQSSQVQQSITTTINTLLWGAGAQTSTINTAAIGESQDVESWGTMYLGGF